ncbi:hypothetical protein [Paenarthrobacter nitroguajacolicus]|uniref:hypothetical protein n=1 Tax=Paenarthrobacter nitroguajacolicus TaxID=211146 RepID=UPI004053FB04
MTSRFLEAKPGLLGRSVNGDVVDLDSVLDAGAQEAREGHLEMLLTLAAKTDSKALSKARGIAAR